MENIRQDVSIDNETGYHSEWDGQQFTFISALAGCGKSEKILTLAAESKNNDYEIIIISSVNSAVDGLRNRAILNKGFSIINPEKEISTFHSLCWKCLQDSKKDKVQQKVRKIRTQLDSVNASQDETIKSEKKGNAYSDMLLEFSDLENDDLTFFKGKCIFLDEAQDLSLEGSKALIKIIDFLKESTGKLFLAGDIYQTIYASVCYLQEIVNKYPFRTICLNTCYRMPVPLLLLVNGYYQQQNMERRYEIPESEKLTGGSCRIHHLSDRTALLRHLHNILKNKLRKGKPVTVICWTVRELKKIEDYLKESNLENKELLILSTIHGAKGSEADTVIFVQMEHIDDDLAETFNGKYLLNVAITRARKNLIILSSNPYEFTEKKFQSSTYRNVNFQNSRTDASEKKNQDLIELGKTLAKRLSTANHLLKRHFEHSLIDSLAFRVNYDDAPFLRHEKKDDKIKNHKYCISSVGYEGEFKFCKKKQRGDVIFEFHDLSLLKKSGFSDFEIISFIKYVIYKHYNFQIDPQKLNEIETQRIDLAKIIRIENVFQLLTFFKRVFIEVSKGYLAHFSENYLKCLFGNKIKNKKNEPYSGEREVSIYLPLKKQKNSIIDCDENDMKIEVRMKSRKRKKGTNMNLSLSSMEALASGCPVLWKGKTVKDISELYRRMLLLNIKHYDAKKLMNFVGDSRKADKNSLYILLTADILKDYSFLMDSIQSVLGENEFFLKIQDIKTGPDSEEEYDSQKAA